MTDHTSLTHAFFALHHGLDRQGPGSDATTRRLLSLTGALPARARGLAGSITTLNADMAELPFPDGSFDLVWAESSAYSIGFDTALRTWRRLLAPGGALVLTECEWTAAEPSAAARAFWERHYTLRTGEENLRAATGAGYSVLGVHPQPESDWDEYYGPLAARADAADPAAPGMAEALAATREEIAMRREHGTEFGYAGYVLRPTGSWPTRPETASDVAAVHAVNAAAFESEAEADLVDALRADPGAWLPGLSYVAEAPDGSVAAHALITRCLVGGAPALALAPVAVLPAHQRTGAGSAVVRALLDAARARGEQLVVVLGHPSYYPRFGFKPASGYGIRPGFEVPDEAMMALVLDGSDDSAGPARGTIQYPAAFGV
ncbi:GNAT family N-acetyltransferase [Streptomyces sp. NPDC058308]|uniref:GNAT family N-acetyltransferase n=1 Tax=Streptomyces sp. NPDC058308 TaxID=3346440 RepID=UPI0036F08CDA